MEISADEIPHDRGRDALQHPMRRNDTRPTCCAVQIIVAGALLARPNWLPPALAIQSKADIAASLQRGVVRRVMQTDDPDSICVVLVLRHFVANVRISVFGDDGRVAKPCRIQRPPKCLRVGPIRLPLVPNTDIVDVDSVFRARALQPFEQVVSGELGMLERVPGLLRAAHPRRECPRQSDRLDARITLLGLAQQPPLITTRVVQVICRMHMARLTTVCGL
mmetsp:Transcript_100821/g.291521  ORF Transcript_100821/g.291521 Transcript_100821/m.291521 type:complete len:221 (+) Transcript_100821:1800-2462(+)